MWQIRTKIMVAASAVVATGAIAAGAFVLAGAKTAAPPPKPKPTPTPTATHSPVPQQLLSPFTGEPVRSLGPVLAVKIDNIVYARPQTGLTAADIVYVLPVEGGLTRFLAIFSSHFPPVIGPVRSTRKDDLELLGQFGRPAFAYSGAQGQLLPVVERARIVDLYAGLVGGYYRDYQRIAPYNLYATTRVLLAEAKGASTAHSIGFRFGPAPAGGQVTRSESVSYPAAKYTFTWSRSEATLAGHDGRHARDDHRRRPAGSRHRRDPAHDRAQVRVPGVRLPAAVRGDHGPRNRRRATQRHGLQRHAGRGRRSTAGRPTPPPRASG